mmetsp:Transcript_124454/g.215697  ORF Transcript_124454/g.215697 Transcript_124454/m.215697 type:complete len:83 (+) Transcript_124454:746-994(+)
MSFTRFMCSCDSNQNLLDPLWKPVSAWHFFGLLGALVGLLHNMGAGSNNHINIQSTQPFQRHPPPLSLEGAESIAELAMAQI